MNELALLSPVARPAPSPDERPGAQASFCVSLEEMQAWLEGSLNELSSAAKALSIGGIIIEEIFGGVAEAKSPVPDKRAAFSALKQTLERSKIIRGATLDKYVRVSIQQQDLPADDARYRFFEALPLSQRILLTKIADPDAKLRLAQQVAEDSLTSKQLERLVAEALGKPALADSQLGPASLLLQMRRLTARLPTIAEWAQRGSVQSPGKLVVATHGLQEQVDTFVESLKDSLTESLEHSIQASGQSRPGRRPGQRQGGLPEYRLSESAAERKPGAPRVPTPGPVPSVLVLDASLEGIASWIEARVRETTGVAKAMRIGDFLIDNVYGSVAEAKSRSPRKGASLRAIEARLKDKGLLSIVTLNNYVRVAIQQRDLPSDDARYQVFGALSLSQRILLTKLKDLDIKLRLAQRAAKDNLTCKQLEALVAEALGKPALADKALETLMDQIRELTAELALNAPADGSLGALFKAAVHLQGHLHCLDQSLELPGHAVPVEAPCATEVLALSRAANCKDEVVSCTQRTVSEHTKSGSIRETDCRETSVAPTPLPTTTAINQESDHFSRVGASRYRPDTESTVGLPTHQPCFQAAPTHGVS